MIYLIMVLISGFILGRVTSNPIILEGDAITADTLKRLTEYQHFCFKDIYAALERETSISARNARGIASNALSITNRYEIPTTGRCLNLEDIKK